MTAAANLFAQQEANRKASRRLVAGFVIFVAWLGFGGDFIWYLASRSAAAESGYGLHVFPGIGILLMIVGGMVAWSGYRFGATMLIKATGAREITAPESDAEQKLVNIVEEMAIAAGTRKPRIWLVPEAAPNAFATGVKPEEAHIAVTEGAIATLNREELQAVVAHEMGHIVNYDVRLMTLLTALVGMIAIVHNMGFRTMRFGGGGGGRRSRSSSKGGDNMGPLVIVLLVLWVISWLVAPLVTRYMAMKVGRSREFLADAMSAQFTRNPGALAEALVKIGGSTVKPTAIPKSSAQLCIADPFHSKWGDREGRFADLMATHPPLRERIQRLKQMAYQNAGTVDSLQSPLIMSEA